MLEDLEDLELIESELLAEQEDLSAIFYLEDLEEETEEEECFEPNFCRSLKTC